MNAAVLHGPDVTVSEQPFGTDCCDATGPRRPAISETGITVSFLCTRTKGHDGDHVAGDGQEVVDIWSSEP